MTPIWRLPRRSSRAISLQAVQIKRHISDYRPFASGDHVILRHIADRTASPLLRGPLKSGKRIDSHKGPIDHDDIIGKRVRDVVRTSTARGGKGTGVTYRLHEVRLEDHAAMTPRLVTPIYPADANLIVSLLDLHPEPRPMERRETAVEGLFQPSRLLSALSLRPADEGAEDAAEEEAEEPALEILEAGTGHGALTLHLSRAVHAANGAAPRGPADSASEEEQTAYAAMLEEWKRSRRAVVHTVDVSPKYSAHASGVVRAFRGGMYHGNVDFHAADVGEWVRTALGHRSGQPFLSHAFLDLPNADVQLAAVAAALRVDGSLIVFNPSITQVTACALKVRTDGIPLELEKVIELGGNSGSGGREWDVRFVKPRASRTVPVEDVSRATNSDGREAELSDVQRKGDGAASGGDAEGSTASSIEGEDSGVEMERDEEQSRASQSSPEDGTSPEDRKTTQDKKNPPIEQGEWSMVCRPKVGIRVFGGGFLGVFKKQRIEHTGED